MAANNDANAKKRKKGGAKANQAAAGRENIIKFNAERGGRPNLRHGVHSVVKSEGRFLPAGCEAFAAEVDAIVAEMAQDLGGSESITAAQKSLLESQRLCLLVLKVAGAYLRSEGLLNKKGKPHPILFSCVSFANTLRYNAVALGLERKTRSVGPASLSEYLDARSAVAPEGAAPVVEP